MIHSQLLENEFIEQEIRHKKHLPFRLEDWLRTLILGGVLTGAIDSLSNDEYIMGSFLLLLALFVGCLPLFMRWKQLQPLKYYITNQRLIIFNEKQDRIVHSFSYDAFPEMTLRDNAYNFGCIILGEPEPLFGRHGIFGMKTGVSLADHEVVLENISEIRKIYDNLRGKVKNARESQ